MNLAQALMCPSDLLLLDEPTNHLDIKAKEVLKGALQAFDGTFQEYSDGKRESINISLVSPVCNFV